ncbi:YeeE/YedE family integral membrane protein-like protein [Aulographum hederae CBS 113979]|uniref:YeeE/YedE family integral membrane protein-like protein n=1 Tax=Aulographum hederae CBS 113979 TaxID=1176131 RepID=A0A6G1HEM2_9PEZI|nr:YeeE/YedE family integral membrane protein-like protein [Aulographum hederae CBS 113979]
MFSPIESALGALLLHQATTALLYNNGTVLGASGLIRAFFTSFSIGSILFLSGMMLSFFPVRAWLPELAPVYPAVDQSWNAALLTLGTGLMTGWGTRLGSGCTSGHMLSGLSRLNARSFLAVGVFFPTAMITFGYTHDGLRTSACSSITPCYTPTYPTVSTQKNLVAVTSSIILANLVLPDIAKSITGRRDYARATTWLTTGFTFGSGLLISGMASPSKVLSFFALDFHPSLVSRQLYKYPHLFYWDPSLALILIFGVGPSLVYNLYRGTTNPPTYEKKFWLNNKTLKDTDWKFVAGAAAFGVGWGLSGICPGPAVLRTVVQPSWGAVWMSGFAMGTTMAG